MYVEHTEEGFQKEDSERACRYVSTRGIRLSCDLHNKPPTSDGMTIYVDCDKLNDFVTSMQSNRYTYILISGAGDISFPESLGRDYTAFLEDDKLLHMFVNNSTVSHLKLTLLPLGLDYHTLNGGAFSWGPQATPLTQDRQLADIQKSLQPFSQRKIKCYGNFHFSMRGDRQDAKDKIPPDCIDYEGSFLPRIETWKKQAEYAFAVCPHGNGLDCHRQWEALCLGCIPIVKTSSIDAEYKNLPVLIVSDWSEVNQALLDSTIQEFGQKQFDMDRLLLSYWMNQINAYKK